MPTHLTWPSVTRGGKYPATGHAPLVHPGPDVLPCLAVSTHPAWTKGHDAALFAARVTALLQSDPVGALYIGQLCPGDVAPLLTRATTHDLTTRAMLADYDGAGAYGWALDAAGGVVALLP